MTQALITWGGWDGHQPDVVMATEITEALLLLFLWEQAAMVMQVVMEMVFR